MTKGQRLKQLREEKGLSQTEVAKKIGVKKQTLYKYEHDLVTNIPSDKIEALAREYDIDERYIMGWDSVTYMSNRSYPNTITDYIDAVLALPPEAQKHIKDIIDYEIRRNSDAKS